VVVFSHIAAVRRRVGLVFVGNDLCEQEVDIDAGFGRFENDGDLAGEQVHASDPSTCRASDEPIIGCTIALRSLTSLGTVFLNNTATIT
jgi:hypothetical protein